MIKPSPTPTPIKTNIDPALVETPPEEPKEIYVTDVPPEFRRIELFIAGTVPNKALITPDETAVDLEDRRPTPSPTPISSTWQDGAEPPDPVSNPERGTRNPELEPGSVTIAICPLTGQRATAKCPKKEIKTFRQGTDPKDFCTYHR